MKKQILILALVLISISSLANRYDVTDFGALGDGKTIDSPAINAAIEAASEKGGGMIYFPAGTYLSYSIRLKSNIHLYLESGAVLEAAQPSATEGYDPAEPSAYTKFQDFGHSHFQNSLIWGEKLENIQISGFGLIYGREIGRASCRERV